MVRLCSRAGHGQAAIVNSRAGKACDMFSFSCRRTSRRFRVLTQVVSSKAEPLEQRRLLSLGMTTIGFDPTQRPFEWNGAYYQVSLTSSDNAAALQAAIDYVASSPNGGSGGVVYLPDGTDDAAYTIASPLQYDIRFLF